MKSKSAETRRSRVGQNPAVVIAPPGSIIKTQSTPYLLDEADFLRLTKSESLTTTWAHRFFAGFVFFFVCLLAKLYNNTYLHGNSDITALDLITLGILAFLMLLFGLMHLLFPSERKRTIKRIREHFSHEVATMAGSPPPSARGNSLCHPPDPYDLKMNVGHRIQ
jgi:hypothetical protein